MAFPYIVERSDMLGMFNYDGGAYKRIDTSGINVD